MRFILAILLSICFSTASYSQELTRLRDLTDNSAATYPYIRCGAMYQAIMERTGIDRMGEASWQQTEEMRMLLFMIAPLLPQKNL